jgi:thiol-disulfide isomerase/thioredoxin
MKVINYTDNKRYDIINDLDNSINIIFIYSNYCHHCHAMMPVWNKVKSYYKKSNIQRNILELEAGDLFKLDYNEINKMVKGYPSMIIINKGKFIKEYNGDRTYLDIIKFINFKLHKKNKQKTKNKIKKNKNKTIKKKY